MTAPVTIDEAILANALGPAAASIDGRGSVTSKTASDLIALRRELASISAESQEAEYGFGLRFGQIQPPGGG